MYDLIIIGAGTAGMTAAIYGRRAAKTVLLLEEKVYGGQILSAVKVENYPGILQISGYDFAENLHQQALALGAEFRYEKAEKIQDMGKEKEVITSRNRYRAGAVILATGAKNRHLGVDREEELTGKGVSYCATCDGAFYRRKETAVVGGGNTALEDAGFLSGYCKTVYVIHRRKEFRGEARLLEALQKKENVRFLVDSQVVALEGEDRLSAVIVQKTDTEETRRLPVEGLFIAVGQAPDHQAFSDLVDLDGYGYIQAAEDCRTRTPGIFAAGDGRTKEVRQLATAAADGAAAALAACGYLEESALFLTTGGKVR